MKNLLSRAILGAIRLAIAAIIVMPLAAKAATTFEYYINNRGDVIPTSPYAAYGDGGYSYGGGYVQLNSETNQIYFQGSSGFQTLNTNLFTVSDITDVTAVIGGTQVYVKTNNGSYYLNSSGQVSDITPYKVYGDNNYGHGGGYVELNAPDNQIYFQGTSGWQTLNTNLFTVNDITDVTAVFNGTAYVTTNSGSYYVNSSGAGSISPYKVYGDGAYGYGGGYVQLNPQENQIYFQGGGGWLTLNTSLFSVSDIVDVSAVFNGTDAYVIVSFPDQVDVPTPGAIALLGIGLAGLAVARRRKIALPDTRYFGPTPR